MEDQERQDNSAGDDAAGEQTENQAEATAAISSEPEGEPAQETVEAAAAKESAAAVAEESQPGEQAQAEEPVAEAVEPQVEEEAPAEVAPPPEMSGLLGRKVGMTTYYTDDGRALGVTAIEVGPCVVTQVKTAARHGYEAVQVGFLAAKSVNKPQAGHLERSGGKFRHLQEFRVKDLADFEVGQQVLANLFATGDVVKVSGVSKGRGFSGGVRRYGFRGGPKTHGQSDRHRAPGAIGAGSSPGRVWPGTKMAGHYGAANVTQRGLHIVLADPSRNLVLIRGAVPGPRNGIVRIEKQSGI